MIPNQVAPWIGNWAWSLPLIVINVIVHVCGLAIIGERVIQILSGSMERRVFILKFSMVMGVASVLGTLLHGFEAFVWAAAYRLLGALPDNRTAMLYSLSAITSYGHANLYLQARWQLMGALEALNGMLLFGLTTAQLQGALPTFQNAGLWSTGPGLYPYLTNFFPNGVQAISGVAYSGAGVSPIAAGKVTADLGGASVGSVTTGANGYYYFLEQAGTISAGGSPTLIYTSSGARLQTLTGTTSGLDIWGQTFIAPTADLTYSTASATTLQTQDSALLTSAEGSDSAGATRVASLTNYGYVATGAGFTLDTPLTLTNGVEID